MKYWKKMVAPIIIAFIVILYYIGITVLWTLIPGIPAVVRILVALIPLILSAVMLGVLINRIKEIQGGKSSAR